MLYLEELNKTPQMLRRVCELASGAMQIGENNIVFCGCGTTYYISGIAAKLCQRAGKAAKAVDAVELIDAEIINYSADTLFVFISRSGDSLEALLAERRVREKGFRCFYIGMTPGSPLDSECDSSFIMPFAKEPFPMEAYSFFSNLLASALLCGIEQKNDPSEAVERGFAEAERIYSELKGAQLGRIISLGAPFYMPMLKEIMLKNGELTQISSELWGILEFRHGPRSWADGSCLVSAIPGVSTFEFDKKCASEIVSYGCRLIWMSDEPLDGAYGVSFGFEKYSLCETLAAAAFSFSLAARLGEERGVDATRLKNVEKNVSRL